MLLTMMHEYDIIIFDTSPPADTTITNILNVVDICYISIQEKKQSFNRMLAFINESHKLGSIRLKTRFNRSFIIYEKAQLYSFFIVSIINIYILLLQWSQRRFI